jgi:hypothetical protein
MYGFSSIFYAPKKLFEEKKYRIAPKILKANQKIEGKLTKRKLHWLTIF